MTTKQKPADDQFMTDLEEAVREVLKNAKSTPAERLKAIDSGAKLLQIKHKIREPGSDGNYFDKSGA